MVQSAAVRTKHKIQRVPVSGCPKCLSTFSALFFHLVCFFKRTTWVSVPIHLILSRQGYLLRPFLSNSFSQLIRLGWKKNKRIPPRSCIWWSLFRVHHGRCRSSRLPFSFLILNVVAMASIFVQDAVGL